MCVYIYICTWDPFFQSQLQKPERFSLPAPRSEPFTWPWWSWHWEAGRAPSWGFLQMLPSHGDPETDGNSKPPHFRIRVDRDRKPWVDPWRKIRKFWGEDNLFLVNCGPLSRLSPYMFYTPDVPRPIGSPGSLPKGWAQAPLPVGWAASCQGQLEGKIIELMN